MTGARGGGGLSVLLISAGACVGGELLNRTGARSWFGRLPRGLRSNDERTRVPLARHLDAQSLGRLRPRHVAAAPLLLIN